MRRRAGVRHVVAVGPEASGGDDDVIRLPELGIRGNSHLLMQDNNNGQIAEMIIMRLHGPQ